MRPWWLYKIGKVLLIAVAAVLVLGFGVMFLWNALIPDLFNGPTLTFWQAAGLLVLSHVLLKGWSHGYYGSRHSHWKRRFEEKLAAMTPEERQKFKQEWKDRCGWYPGMEKDKDQQGQAKA